MDKDYISVRSGEKYRKSLRPKEKKESVTGGMSLKAKLVLTLLVILFLALNGAGYYFYREGYFGAGADIVTTKKTPSQTTTEDNKRDAIFMIPEAP